MGRVFTISKTSKRYELKECPECGKLVQGEQGLWGHLCLAHGIKRLTKVVRLEKELAEFQTMMGWKEQEWVNQRLEYEKQINQLKAEVKRLEGYSAFDEYLAGEQERAGMMFKQVKCPYCGKAISEHNQVDVVRGEYKGRKGFVCPS